MTNHSKGEEENYFTDKEIERRKEKEFQDELNSLRDQEVTLVSEQLGIDDRELATHLLDLGFEASNVAMFPLIPLVYVAWADGDVSASERSKILEIANAQGLDPDSEAFALLNNFLEERPSDAFLEISVKAIRRIYELLPAGEATDAKTDLISLSIGIANTSGGFLGIFGDKISDSERSTITGIMDDLGLNSSSAAQDLLTQLGDA